MEGKHGRKTRVRKNATFTETAGQSLRTKPLRPARILRLCANQKKDRRVLDAFCDAPVLRSASVHSLQTVRALCRRPVDCSNAERGKDFSHFVQTCVRVRLLKSFRAA